MGWRKKTPTVIQMEAVECGAACLCIILAYYGRYVPLAKLRIDCGVSRDGSNAANLIKAGKLYGLEGKGFRVPVSQLAEKQTPFIAFWEVNHFIVVEGIHEKGVYVNDPGSGPRFMTHEEFAEGYSGIILTFSPTDQFKKGGKPTRLFVDLHERLKDVKPTLIYLFLAGICLLLPGLALPAFIRFFVDEVLVSHKLGSATFFLLAIALMVVLAGSLFWLQNYVLNRLSCRLSIQSSSNFFSHILRLPVSFYTQRYPGEIAYRTTLNEHVARQITGNFATTSIDVLLVVFYGIVMLMYNVTIGLIGFLAAAVTVGVFAWVQRTRQDAFNRMHQEGGKWIGTAIGAIRQMETIKAAGMESDLFVRFAGLYTNNINTQQKISKLDAILGMVPVAAQSLAMAALLAVGSWQIMQGQLTFGMLIALQTLLIAFLTPISRFVNFGQSMQYIRADINRLNDVLKNKIDPLYHIRTAKESEGKLEGYLEFKDVTFGYSPLSPPLIKSLSFTIKPGQRVALVGPSGCGKSTIAKLATGLFLPWEGTILYDGKPLKDISPTVFYHSVGYIDQQIFLFSGTVHDNITLWNPAVTDEMVVKSAEDAAIHEEIVLRPKGYQGLLEERGKNLSGGQQQRLEIARALLYSPSFLVMDEATSALDSTTEKMIADNVRRRGCAAILIAHRLSTIQDCDEILVLDKGEIVERGTHEQLKQQAGIYQQLIESE